MIRSTPSRRLYPLGAAPRQQCVPKAGLVELERADFVGQPGRQLLLVAPRGFPEPERLSDLGPVVLDGPSGPVVGGKLGGVDLHLLGDVLHSGIGELADVAGEATFLLEELQEKGEAEPCRSALVADECRVTLNERPARDQILGFPLPTHEAPPPPASPPDAATSDRGTAYFAPGVTIGSTTPIPG